MKVNPVGKKSIIILVIIVVLAVLGFMGYKQMRDKGYSGYSLVYLQTGQIYVGKLATFPRLKMTDGYFLSVTSFPKEEEKEDAFQLIPLSEAVWAPKDLYINKDNVMFYGQLQDDSLAADALRNAGK